MKTIIRKKNPYGLYILSLVCIIIAVLTWFIIKPEDSKVEGDGEVVIVMPYSSKLPLLSTDESEIGFDILESMVNDYKLVNKDVKIKVKYIDSTDQNQYIAERNAMLMSEDPPELFFISDAYFRDGYVTSDLSALMDSGVGVDLSKKLKNYDQLEEGLKFETYLPVGLQSIQGIYDRDALTSIGMDENKLAYSADELKEIFDKFVEVKQPNLDFMSFSSMNRLYFGVDRYIDSQTGLVSIDINQIMDDLLKIKLLIASDQLSLERTTSYKAQVEALNSPSEKMIRLINKRNQEGGYYPFYGQVRFNFANPRQIGDTNYGRARYRFIMSRSTYTSIGFVANQQSGDLDKALDFLDYCISFKRQLTNVKFYDNYSGMVNRSDLEALKIAERKDMSLDPRAQELRDLFYLRLNNHELIHIQANYDIINSFSNELYELIQWYLLSDELTEKQVEQELKKMKSEYMFQLME
jgi:spermidine/putrescine-binding protein